MKFNINGRIIETDEQGYLYALGDWSEDFAERIAELDGIELFDDHWGLIYYFRDYYEETLRCPTMHQIVLTLGKQKGQLFHERKDYERFLYELFSTDPVHELCKLAGLPKPQPDT